MTYITDQVHNQVSSRYMYPDTKENSHDYVSSYASDRSNPETKFTQYSNICEVVGSRLTRDEFLYHLNTLHLICTRAYGGGVPLSQYKTHSHIAFRVPQLNYCPCHDTYLQNGSVFVPLLQFFSGQVPP